LEIPIWPVPSWPTQWPPRVPFADEIAKALAGATSSGQKDFGVTGRVFGPLPT
jgi:hypothetical protein